MYFKDIAPGELETLPLHILRHVDIRSREEEEIIQAEVNKRLAVSPDAYVPLVFPSTVTDNFGKPGHMTEAEAQEKIEAHRKAFLATLEGTHSHPEPVENVEAAPVDTTPLVDDVVETVMKPVTINVTKGGRPRKNS